MFRPFIHTLRSTTYHPFCQVGYSSTIPLNHVRYFFTSSPCIPVGFSSILPWYIDVSSDQTLYSAPIKLPSVNFILLYSHNHNDINNNNTDTICRFRLRSMATRGERHNSYNVDPTRRASHLVMFNISVGRDLKNPTTSFNGQNPTLRLNGPISTASFSKSSNSQDHLFRAWLHPPSNFLSGGLLWQWWLSYPLHRSVNSTNWLCTWAPNPNTSKPN